MIKFICKYCEEEFLNSFSKSGHTGHCKLNPNYEKNKILVREKGQEKIKENKNLRKTEYDKNKKDCLNCKRDLEYKDKHKKFCSSSCSASYNNSKRDFSNKPKRVFSKEAIENMTRANKNRKTIYEKCRVYFKICFNCKKNFSASTKERKTCSEDCRVNFIMNTRVRNKYTKEEYKGFNFDSSWELKIAKWFDENNIIWERGHILKYLGNNSKEHKYFPDFYLPKYNLYVEPKNKMLIEKDKVKLEYFKNRINLLFGHVDFILNELKTRCIPSV